MSNQIDRLSGYENQYSFWNKNFELQNEDIHSFIVKRLPLSLTTSFATTPTYLPIHFSNKRAERFTPEAFHVDNLESPHDQTVISPLSFTPLEEVEVIQKYKITPLKEERREPDTSLLQQFSQLFHF